MKEKIIRGEAIDLSENKRTADGDYILDEFISDMDYCNSETEEWIWSIGKHLRKGSIFASHSGKYYQNKEFKCLFLR